MRSVNRPKIMAVQCSVAILCASASLGTLEYKKGSHNTGNFVLWFKRAGIKKLESKRAPSDDVRVRVSFQDTPRFFYCIDYTSKLGNAAITVTKVDVGSSDNIIVEVRPERRMKRFSKLNIDRLVETIDPDQIPAIEPGGWPAVGTTFYSIEILADKGALAVTRGNLFPPFANSHFRLEGKPIVESIALSEHEFAMRTVCAFLLTIADIDALFADSRSFKDTPTDLDQDSDRKENDKDR